MKSDIENYDQGSYRDWLIGLNQEDLSIDNATRKFSSNFSKFLSILDIDGLKYTPRAKANAFQHSLENSFQTNPEPYNSNITKVNNTVNKFLNSQHRDNNINLTSPMEIHSILKKINPEKVTGPDGIPNKPLNMIPINLWLV